MRQGSTTSKKTFVMVRGAFDCSYDCPAIFLYMKAFGVALAIYSLRPQLSGGPTTPHAKRKEALQALNASYLTPSLIPINPVQPYTLSLESQTLFYEP